MSGPTRLKNLLHPLLPPGTKTVQSFKIGIWTLGIGVLIGVTIKDFIPLLSEYNNNNLATQVEVIIGDSQFQPPQLVLQFPMSDDTDNDFEINQDIAYLSELSEHLYNGTEVDCDMCIALEANSWDVWNHENLTEYRQYGYDTFYDALGLALTRKLFDTISKGTRIFDPAYSSWNQPILAAGINFFMWQNYIDYSLAFPPQFPVPLRSQFIALQKNFVQEADTVFEQVWAGLCQHMSFSEFTKSDDLLSRKFENVTCESMFHKTPFPISILDGAAVPLPPTKLPKPKDYQFRFKPGSFFGRSARGKGDITFFAEPSIQYGTRLNPLIPSYIYEIPLDAPEQSFYVSIKYSVQIRAKETRLGEPCQDEVSPSVCIKKCTLYWIIEHCGCVPFSMAKGLALPDPNPPYCTVNAYDRCTALSTCHLTGRADYCLAKCKAVCQYTSYNWHINHRLVQPSHPNETELTIAVYPIFHSFPQFSWTHKSTVEQFISQMGGIVNLYLGVSGVTFVALAVAFIDFLSRFCQRENAEQAGQRQPVRKNQAWVKT